MVTTSSAARLEILGPRDEVSTTSQDVTSVLGRVRSAEGALPGTANVGGVEVPVLPTGLFVRDRIPLTMGENTIRISVAGAGGATSESGALAREIRVARTTPVPPAGPPPSTPLMIDARSIQPDLSVALQPSDLLEVSFKGASGNVADFRIRDDAPWISMEEQRNAETGALTGIYRGTVTASFALPVGQGAFLFPLPQVAADATSQPLTVRMRSVQAAGEPTGAAAGETSGAITMNGRANIAVWGGGQPTLLRVRVERGNIVYGLTEVRLGGPILAEVPRGTILRAVGRRGPNYRVRLTPGLDAWIHASDVEPAPPGTGVPHSEFTLLSVTSSADGDVISIPYSARIPFAISASQAPVSVAPFGADDPALMRVDEPRGPVERGGAARANSRISGDNEVTIDLYGAHLAATWLVHKNPLGIVREIVAEQPDTDHLRLHAHLGPRRCWGYKWEATTDSLKITVRRPPPNPATPLETGQPLQGLTIAVEAGHGGNNAGARGHAAGLEREINLAVALKLGEELSRAGARVAQVRTSDESISMQRRAGRAVDAGAQLFVSIHCNSDGGGANGYLTTSGTATFTKYPFSWDLADVIHRRIIAHTGLPDYGNVGNFNYTPVRLLTWMPAVLVEQAFLSNPIEEAKLLDPAFQATMAQAIREGLEDYMRQVWATETP